ncbi:Pycsar system effector family protein [Methanolapillus africanus]|uniref:Pycsar system effector family protein n=1 Tax=Methanolapillus africanus TaxID=3028297 RepID=UPI0030B87B7E
MRDFLYQTYDMVLERLKYAEAKNTIIVTLLGALVIGGFRIYNETPYRPDIATFYFWNFILFAVFAITVSLSSFMPNIKLQFLYKGKTPAETDSLIYYEHISKYDVETYLTAVNRRYFDSEATPGNLDFDVAAQIIINSRSAYRKYSISYYAIVFSIFAILTPVVGIIYFFLSSRVHLTNEDGKTKVQYGKIKFIEDIKELTGKSKKKVQGPISKKRTQSTYELEQSRNKFFTAGVSKNKNSLSQTAAADLDKTPADVLPGIPLTAPQSSSSESANAQMPWPPDPKDYDYASEDTYDDVTTDAEPEPEHEIVKTEPPLVPSHVSGDEDDEN